MHLPTFIITTAVLALAKASPSQKQYGNETTSGWSALTGTNGAGLETMPSIFPSNATSMANPMTSSNVIQITTTAIGSTTLTYTLGPKGSSSVVTTVIENTSTITMTSTIYITMTTSDEPTGTTIASNSEASSSLTAISEGTPIESGDTFTTDLSGDEAMATTAGGESLYTETIDQPTDIQFNNAPSATLEPDTSESDNQPTLTEPGDDPIVTQPSEDSTPTPSDDEPIVSSGFAASEPTVTVTNYQTTTETITMETIPTGANSLGFSDVGISALFGSAHHHLPPWISSLLGGHGGACSVTTMTATVIEQSTVTVTPTSTDNFPIPPTVTPSYGFGNGTDPTTGFPTASSGFLTLYRRSTPTKL